MCQLGISVMSVLPFAHHDNMTPTPVVPLAAYVGSGSEAACRHVGQCPLYPQKRTYAVQRTSGRAFPTVSFVYLSVECPSNKFYGINCRPKLGAKLLDRFFHRRRQVSPPVNRLTHRFFDGSQHFLYCNFTVGSRHSAVASSFSRLRR